MRQRVLELAEFYGDRLQVSFGVEVGYHVAREDDISPFIQQHPFDFVLGGVHVVDGVKYSYSKSCRLAARRGISAREFSQNYVRAMRQMVASIPIDAVAHIDTPKRHGRYFRHPGEWRTGYLTPASPCWGRVCCLLDEMIKKGILLEMNASGLRQPAQEVYPCRGILHEYYRLGGRLVTLGSDSHTPDTLGFGLPQAAQMAASLTGVQQAWFGGRSLTAHPLHRCE